MKMSDNIKGGRFYTITCEGKSHTFDAGKIQETWKCGKYLFIQRGGTIQVYDLTKFDQTQTSGYMLIDTIEFCIKKQLPNGYQQEELITSSINQPLMGQYDVDYRNYSLMKQQQITNRIKQNNPQVAYYADIHKNSDYANPSQRLDLKYNPDTRKIYDGFDAGRIEFNKKFQDLMRKY